MFSQSQKNALWDILFYSQPSTLLHLIDLSLLELADRRAFRSLNLGRVASEEEFSTVRSLVSVQPLELSAHAFKSMIESGDHRGSAMNDSEAARVYQRDRNTWQRRKA